MPFVLQHESNKSWLVADDGFTITETTDKKKATRFITEASAIITLEDSDFQGNYTPEFTRI